ncbi:fumarylacetoacetate hydrolase family protein [uncultured Friedmanniella sp.]|uniref:fumarylacetoacetate hydrolase family protein n=1 Tax=uncultured Friedmanniella sp. TaxID=335381 RepID=UPI0035CC4AE1
MSRNAAHAGPYALGTFAAGGRSFAGLVVGQRVHPLEELSGLPHPSVRELLEHWESTRPALDALADRVADDEPGLELLELELLKTLPPVEPRQIFQSGANYRTHVMDLAAADRKPGETRTAEEIREEVGRQQDARAASGEPYVFTGLVSAMCGAYDDVVLPEGTKKNDFELELAAVIGRPARRVSVEDALDHVAGYTIVNDVTTREWVWRRDLPELGTDWFRGKNSPTFLPTGPFLVPADFVGDPMDLRVTLKLNGDVMQDESTKDMIFDVAQLVSYCSSIATLLPGDLVLTGSPAGNGMHWGRLLRAGDVMESEITGLGVQRNGCRDE